MLSEGPITQGDRLNAIKASRRAQQLGVSPRTHQTATATTLAYFNNTPTASNLVNFTVGPSGTIASDRERAAYQSSVSIDLSNAPNRSAVNTRRNNMLVAQAALNSAIKSSSGQLTSSGKVPAATATVKASNTAGSSTSSRQPNFIANSANTSNAAHLLLNNTSSLLHSTQSVPGMAVHTIGSNMANSSPNNAAVASSPTTLRRSTRSTGHSLVSGATGNLNSSSPAKRYK